MLKIPARGRHVTQEPQTIASHLLGQSLATFRRRMFSYLIDMIVFGLIVGLVFVGLTAWSFYREDPTLISRAKVSFAKLDSGAKKPEIDQVLADLYFMIDKRCPDAFPRHLATMVRARDLQKLGVYSLDTDTTVGFGNGKTRYVENSDTEHQLVIGMDLLMGRLAGVFGWGGLFVVWFTFWPFVTGGRSPGKVMVRIKVIRLEGSKLRLWDCFARAGGYSASAATLMLGFLEAIWHPNRQAIHDKIAGTVVVKG